MKWGETSLCRLEAKPGSHRLPGLWCTGKARGPREQDTWWDSGVVVQGGRSGGGLGQRLRRVSQAPHSAQSPEGRGSLGHLETLTHCPHSLRLVYFPRVVQMLRGSSFSGQQAWLAGSQTEPWPWGQGDSPG